MTAASWAEVPASCACGWSAAGNGPWTRTAPDPRCPAAHEEDCP
jgi:hypothetical protein